MNRSGCIARRVRSFSAALVFAGVTLAAPAVFADESTAEELFQQGLAAMKKNDFAVACEAFSKSNRADPSPGTQINLAVCYEKQKKWASAWTWYRSAVGLAQQRNQPTREKTAEDSATRLKSQIHYLVVAIKEPLKDPVVRRDGVEVTTSLGGKDVPLPVDPGQHTIEVTAGGKKPWSKTITIADTPGTEQLDVPPLENAPVEPTPVGPVGMTAVSTPVVETNPGGTQRAIGIVVGATGLAAGVVGLGFQIVALSEDKKANDALDREKTAAAASDADGVLKARQGYTSHHDAAVQDQTVAIISWAAGGVLLGVGAVLYFTAPRAKEKPAARIVPVPLIGSGVQGFGFVGTF